MGIGVALRNRGRAASRERYMEASACMASRQSFDSPDLARMCASSAISIVLSIAVIGFRMWHAATYAGTPRAFHDLQSI